MSSASSLHDPARVGRYRLVQRLGEGGMGVVHLGLDPDGRAVAIKVLRAHVSGDPDARRRLAREVETLRRVRHPRVAAVLDADVDSDVPYLVTTFVPGKPLDTYVRDHGPLPRGHVARIGAVLAEALRAIHAAGVVHRDLKPANVMLLDGEPVLIDFGIAHVADESRITHTGLVMGTPGYLSPEIVGGEPVTEATDWWAWGATLAFAATGRPPFGTGPVEVVLDRVRRGRPDLDGVEAGLRGTLTAALSVDPGHRPSPDRLVAGLAAISPPRGGDRRAVASSRSEAPTLRTAPPGAPPATGRPAASVPGEASAPGARSRPAAGAGAAAAGGAAAGAVAAGAAGGAAARAGAAGSAASGAGSAASGAGSAASGAGPAGVGEAVTAVVPPPAPWGSPPLPETRRFDPPARGAAGRAPAPGQNAPGPNAPGPNPPGWPPPARPAPAPAAAGPDDATQWYGAGPSAAADGPAGPANGFARPSRGGPVAPRRPADPPAAPDPGPPPATPADPTRGVLVGVLVVLAAVASVAPYGAVWIALIGMTLARVVDRTHTALLVRRDAHGPRGGDVVVTVLALPWRLLTAAVATAFMFILPAMIGVSVAFIVGGAVSWTPGRPGPLAAGMAALLLTAWYGPGGGALRHGARRTVASTVRNRRGQLVTWAVLGLMLASALIVVRNNDRGPDWGPWEGRRIVEMISPS